MGPHAYLRSSLSMSRKKSRLSPNEAARLKLTLKALHSTQPLNTLFMLYSATAIPWPSVSKMTSGLGRAPSYSAQSREVPIDVQIALDTN